MSNESEQEVYPLGRDRAESIRLNKQHKFLVDIVNGPFDKSIPLDDVFAVADVGTGTGIWLLEAQRHLSKALPSPRKQRYNHGFDISSAQFPPSSSPSETETETSSKDTMDFSVQNILHPFPIEHHNRYDLVHVRLLITAFATDEFRNAVENLLTILSMSRPSFLSTSYIYKHCIL
ncbi:hypothetical protein BJX99DRAFT_264824 [Aspergillus californicus]